MPLKPPKNIHEETTTRFVAYAVGCELIDPMEVDGRISCSKIFLFPNTGFEAHIHPSDHLLIILHGDGVLRYWEEETESRIEVKEGDVFPVPREFEHALSAGARGMTFLAIGTPARVLVDPERMKLV